MTRRYAIFLAPVEHINGKLAPSSYVCRNMPDSTESDVSFYYGYKLAKRPEVSRYALRERARNLSQNPYTADETANKVRFKDCAQLAKQLLSEPQWRKRIQNAFRKQPYYIKLYNYAVAELVRNNGAIPPHW